MFKPGVSVKVPFKLGSEWTNWAFKLWIFAAFVLNMVVQIVSVLIITATLWAIISTTRLIIS